MFADDNTNSCDVTRKSEAFPRMLASRLCRPPLPQKGDSHVTSPSHLLDLDRNLGNLSIRALYATLIRLSNLDNQRQPPPQQPPAINRQLSDMDNQRQPPPHQPPAIKKQLPNIHIQRQPPLLQQPAINRQLPNMDIQRKPPPHQLPAINRQLHMDITVTPIMDIQRQQPPPLPHQPPAINKQLWNPGIQAPAHQSPATNKQLSNIRPPAPLQPPSTSRQLANMDSPAPPQLPSTTGSFKPDPVFKRWYLMPLFPDLAALIEKMYIAKKTLKPLHETIKKAESQLEEIIKTRSFTTPIINRRLRSIPVTDRDNRISITASSSSLAPPQQDPASLPLLEPTIPEIAAKSITCEMSVVPTVSPKTIAMSQVADDVSTIDLTNNVDQSKTTKTAASLEATLPSSDAPLDNRIADIRSISTPLDSNDPSSSSCSIFDPVLIPKRQMAKKHTGPRKNKKSLSPISKQKLKYGIKSCQIILYDFKKEYGETCRYGEWDPVARSTYKKNAGKQKVSNTIKDRKKSTEISKKFPDNDKCKMEVTVPKNNKRSHSEKTKSGPTSKKLKKGTSGDDSAVPIRINLSRLSGNIGVEAGGNSSKGDSWIASYKDCSERDVSSDDSIKSPTKSICQKDFNGGIPNVLSNNNQVTKDGRNNKPQPLEKNLGSQSRKSVTNTTEQKTDPPASVAQIKKSFGCPPNPSVAVEPKLKVEKKVLRAINGTVGNKKSAGALNGTEEKKVRALSDTVEKKIQVHKSYLKSYVSNKNNNDDSFSDNYKKNGVVRLPDDKAPSASLDLSAVNLQRLNPQRVKPDISPRPVRWDNFSCRNCYAESCTLSDWIAHAHRCYE